MVPVTSSATAKPARVLMVCPRFLPDMGGVQTHVFEIGRRLVSQGCSVDVLTLDAGTGLASSDVIDGINVRRVAALPWTGEARVAPGLFQALRAGSWDLIHIQHFHAVLAPMVLWWAWRRNIPTVVTFHGGGQRHWVKLRLWPPGPALLAPFMVDVCRPLLRRARGLVGVARFEIADLARRTGLPEARFTLLRNGCDLPQIASDGRRRDRSAPRIVSAGRLYPNKGHELVLEAFPHVLARRPGARLWLAGAGPLEPSLRARAQALGVADRVDIFAVASDQREDWARRLGAQDVLVSLSEFEAHPVAAIEALALGLSAVVADDEAGLAELGQQGLARVVDRGAPLSELAQTIVAAADSQEGNVPVAFPTWDASASQTLALYHDILESDFSGPVGAASLAAGTRKDARTMCP